MSGWRPPWLGGVIGTALLCTGCYTPSMVFMNDDWKASRCAAYGTGYMGVAAASGIYEQCVKDMKMLGYVPIPPVVLGVTFETAMPLTVRRVTGATSAGWQVGDIVRTIDGRTIQVPTDMLRALAHKQAGDVVQVTLERQGQDVRMPVTLGIRGE